MNWTRSTFSFGLLLIGALIAALPQAAPMPDKGAAASVPGTAKTSSRSLATVEGPASQGAAGALSRFLGPEVKEPAQGNEAERAGPREASSKAVWEALATRIGPEVKEPREASSKAVWEALATRIGNEGKGVAVEVLITMVPDPRDSRFGYHFDSTLDAVQLAIESDGYVQDHFWLPWLEGSAGEGPAGAATAGSSGRARKAPPWEREPGLILFRNFSEEKKKLLALLVVGETSTWGVHKDQFLKGLEIARLLDARLGTKDHPLRVAGPFFTGSATSISLALARWVKAYPPDPAPWHLEICAGGATEIDKDYFQRNIPAAPFKGFPQFQVNFSQTLNSEDWLYDRMMTYFQRQRPTWLSRKANVALLIESGTSFGRQFGRGIAKTNSPMPLVIAFPTHISDVESQFPTDASGTGAKFPRLITPINTIPIPFGQTGDPKDVVPALAPHLSAPKDNLVLSHILSTISREGVRYVGIIATDTRDKIFLINLLTKFCPDVQIFLTKNDLLLTNPEFSHELEGAIVASTYPLYSPNQTWSNPYRGETRRVLFAQESDEAYYNATLMLLKREQSLLDYGTPRIFHPGGAVEARPPVWISVVGQHGPWQ